MKILIYYKKKIYAVQKKVCCVCSKYKHSKNICICNDKLVNINPSIVTGALQGYKQKGAYIATQGPLKSTVPEFWRMVHEFQCGCIVMLCELEEDGQVWAHVNIS